MLNLLVSEMWNCYRLCQILPLQQVQ